MNDPELIHSPIILFQVAILARKAAHHNDLVLIQNGMRQR
jgi:hypothetical protein